MRVSVKPYGLRFLSFPLARAAGCLRSTASAALHIKTTKVAEKRMDSAVPTKPLRPFAEVNGHKPIRLILSDFDGTFTDHRNEIPKGSVEGFCLAQKLGIYIGFATGRGKRSAVDGLRDKNATAMNYEGFPGIFCNGSVVYGPGGETVLNATFSSSVQRRVLDALKQRGLIKYVMGLTESESYCCEYNEWTLVCYNAFAEEKPVLLPDEENLYQCPINKFMVWQRHEDLIALRKELEQELGDVIDFTMPYSQLLELARKGNSKGTGLQALAKHLGISADEVLVVGDSENDVSMFKEAGIAVAVGDAGPEAKNAAMYKTCCSGEGPLLDIVQTLKEKGLCPQNTAGCQ